MSLGLAAWLAAGGEPATAAQPAAAPPVVPYESAFWPVDANAVDEAVDARLRRAQLPAANPCSDEVFVRRVYLDVIGTLPTPTELLAFLRDPAPDKRAQLIEQLLQRPEYADYWAMKWCDLLRVKAEFPINLWPNAVQAYHRWILDSLWANKPYDEFARELLTVSGSNFRVPAVNFYRAAQGRGPDALAEAVGLTFMGVRVGQWPDDERAELARFFSRVAYKSTAEWKEEIVYLDPAAATEPLQATFPDGAQMLIPAGADPRQVFAVWLTAPGNPWFTRNIANRVWSWLMGRGIIHEPDDIRSSNPPSNPELLALLEAELVSADYDLKHLFRLILNSRTYQQSSIPRSEDPRVDELFARYPVRRLDAEVLADALNWLTGEGDSYSSPIPEPFTWIPDEQRTIALADGSITSPFLEMFGRPSRDTGLESERNNEPTDAQRLYMLNSGDMQRRLERCSKLRNLVTNVKGDRQELIGWIYGTVLTRGPTREEAAAAEAYLRTPGLSMNQGAVDLVWALINTKEFLYRH